MGMIATRRSRQVVLCLVAAAALAAGGLVVFASRETVTLDVQAVPVTTGPVEHLVVASGTLQATTTVDVGTQISGVVQALDADYNSLVRANEIVARLDPALYDAALREARASLAQAEANVRRLQAAEQSARFTLARDEQLAASNMLPRADLDAARAAMDSASADVKGAQAQAASADDAVKAAAVDLEHTVIRSPVDGVVLARNVEVGQTLAASVQAPVLYRIAVDLRQLQLWVNVDESDVADIRAGEQAIFSVESYGTELFQGTVSQVRLQPVVQVAAEAASAPAPAGGVTSTPPTVTSYTTIVDVANPDERLRPGMTATVTLRGSHHDAALLVPNAALSFQPPAAAGAIVDDTATLSGLHELWRYDHGQLTPVAVKTGLSGGGWTELIGGTLRPGDEVATGVVTRRTSALSRVSTWIP